MSLRLAAPETVSSALRQGRRLLRDRSGAAAIEFAFVVPFLLSMYFITMEAAQGIEANKKVGRVASTVADLVTQQDKITKAEIEAIMTIGETVIRPYNRSKPDIILTAIEISVDPVPKATVAWSRKIVNGKPLGGLPKGTAVQLPPALNVPDSYLIHVEATLDYNPMITWSQSNGKSVGLIDAFSNIGMSESYYLRPRISRTIDCDDC